jgi:hypothetical protein
MTDINITTAWSSGREPTTGLDQLGIRGNSARMYGHLVPGITNLTNRVRYYSMHAWFVNWWAKNVSTDDSKAFNKKIRIFECLVGLAEKIKNHDEGKDFVAVTGSNTFTAWLGEQKDLKDGVKVPLEDLAKKYWKYSSGGFGQYYRGSADTLGIISEKEGVLALTTKYGLPLAEAFQSNIVSTALDTMLKSESATIGQLRKLVVNSTFQKIDGQEGALLQKSLFDKEKIFGVEGVRRRNTLLTILALANETKSGVDENPLWQVLDAALHGRTRDKSEFSVPNTLKSHFELWKTYALHEYFAVAFEALVSAAVSTIGEDEFDGGLSSIEEVAALVTKKLSVKLSKRKWDDLLKESVKSWKYPLLDPSTDPFDEYSLRDQLWDNEPVALENALKLFARITSRSKDSNPYNGFVREKMLLMGDRISLSDGVKFSRERGSLTCGEVLRDLVAWGLRTHLRTATAKLVQTRIYTYKVAFANGYLTQIASLDPALSQPRLEQATRMLTDLGLLIWKGERLITSANGRKILEENGCQ